MIQVVITASATLLAVGLGGWMTTRAQARLLRRDEAREWRDIRLTRYSEFLIAFREYVAYLQLPGTTLIAVERSRHPRDLMPIFLNDAGTARAQRLDAARSTLNLITNRSDIIKAARDVVHSARRVAAERAATEPASISADLYDRMWDAKRRFEALARDELGVTNATDSRT